MPPPVCLHPTTDLLRNIIMTEMCLQPDRIWVFNQKWKIPSYSDLFVIIEYKYGRTYSSRLIMNPSDTALTAQQKINKQESLAIVLCSRNRDAEFRKEEAIFALNSIYAQQLQEKFGFQIARIAPDQNLSSLEGAAMLNRFDIPVTILTHYSKEKPTTFFDTFDTQVRVNDGTPDIVRTFTEPISNPIP